jgi:glycosyltransferase involved in cell wall biosynthesis
VIVNLKIVGDGPLLSKLKFQVNSLALDNQVLFLGRVENKLLPEILLKSELYLSVPITEGASASLMEAMASGCYPIVTDLPGNKAFISNNRNGDLVKVGSTEELVMAMERYLAKPKVEVEKILLLNRRYVELRINQKKNMEFFYKKYTEILISKVSHVRQ